jgi:hypothetical protein
MGNWNGTYYELYKNTPVEERKYYVYIWFENVAGEPTPFYVGMGSGNRANNKCTRSKALRKYIEGKNIEIKIVADKLPLEIAYKMEEMLKCALVARGYKLFDGEHDKRERKRRQAEGIAAMPVDERGRKISKKTGRGFGRVEKRPENFAEVYGRQQNGELSLKEALALTGIGRTRWYELAREGV